MCLHKITLVDKGELPEDTMLPRAWDFDFFFFFNFALAFVFLCLFKRQHSQESEI